jgi:hypothetical protein
MIRNCSLGAAALLVLAVSPTYADQPHSSADKAPLFADDAVFDVTIEGPIEALMFVRPDSAYLQGRFAYTETDGSELQLALKFRTRGNYRRDPLSDRCRGLRAVPAERISRLPVVPGTD